jgi:23S rRNA pseudouridine1911/1915/1917 synthase
MSDFVIFEDRDIVVVDKPAGAIVHRAPGWEETSLADELAKDRPGMKQAGSAQRPGVVHRLDVETSGVMVFAKTAKAYAFLRREFESHEHVEKKYLAVLHGAPGTRKGAVDNLIGRKPWDPKRMAVVETQGKRAVSSYEVLQRKGPVALVEFSIKTGRTHQIRVHAAHLGCPIVGDKLYGDAKLDSRLRIRPHRQLLHAVELAFRHPSSGEVVCFAAPPPDDIVYSA